MNDQERMLAEARAKCEAALRERWKDQARRQAPPKRGKFVLFFEATDDQARRIAQDVQERTGTRPTLNRDGSSRGGGC